MSVVAAEAWQEAASYTTQTQEEQEGPWPVSGRGGRRETKPRQTSPSFLTHQPSVSQPWIRSYEKEKLPIENFQNKHLVIKMYNA